MLLQIVVIVLNGFKSHLTSLCDKNGSNEMVSSLGNKHLKFVRGVVILLYRRGSGSFGQNATKASVSRTEMCS